MTVTVDYLYKKSENLYGMKILAGEAGMNRTVEWIHMIEGIQPASFLHGGELVFLTGISCDGEVWLQEYVKKLFHCQCAGIVVNIGPYIKHIPSTVIDFCNEHKLPLFTIPWEVHLVDVTRYMCRFMIDDEKKKQCIIDALQEILLFPGQCQNACAILENNGFSITGEFRAIVIRSENLDNNEEILAFLKIWNSQIVAFAYHADIVVIQSGKNLNDDESIAMQIFNYLAEKHLQIFISVGSVVRKIADLSLSYHQASAINILAEREEQSVVYYEKMGVYKLLLNGTPKTVIKQFYEDTLGPLEDYDKSHTSNLMETLYYYLEHECSIKKTADHEVVHRNTILYKFNKIEQILGISINNEEDKLAILMAFKIRRLL